ncbi:MAG: beta-lactamase family protein [Caldilineaceae bacterium]|nr:beta-lactamase family protein [Caldilineaceae bacterium]
MATDSTQRAIQFDNLQGEIAARMAEHDVPGAAVGVYVDGLTFTAGLGVTNVDHPLLVTPQTFFQIGSITKTFMGTLTMQLVEQGKLDLDAPVRTYLPDFAVADEAAAAGATVRTLLTHNAGWVGDFFIDTGDGADACTRYVARMADLAQLAPQGAHYSYNNASFGVLGAIIETVTEEPFEDVLQRLLIEPLGLQEWVIHPTDVMTKRFAVGHRAGDDGIAVATPWPLPRCTRPAGGIITTVGDLLTYARFHLREGVTDDGTRLLTPASIAAMRTPQTRVWGDDEAIGLTWFIDRRDGVTVYSHGGGTVGQISLLATIPERNFALAVVTNGQSGGHVTRAAFRWALRHMLDVTPFVPRPIPVDAATLDAFAGDYTRPFQDLALVRTDDGLQLQLTPKLSFPVEDGPLSPAPPAMNCTLCAPDRLLVLDGGLKDSVIDMIRDEDGTVRYARLGRLHARKAG